MIKYLLMTILSASILFAGCKSCNNCQQTGRDSSVIESEDHYVPWWVNN